MIARIILILCLVAAGEAVTHAARAAPICPMTALTNGTPTNATAVMTWFDCKAPLDSPRFGGTAAVDTGGTYSPGLEINTLSAGQQATIVLKSLGTTKWQFGKGTDDGFFLNYAPAGRTDFQIAASGEIGLGTRVGIGTGAPAVPLSIMALNEAYTPAVEINTQATGQQATMVFRSFNASKWQMGKGTDDGFFLNYVPTGRTDIQISTSGAIGLGNRVGVGTSAPTVPLSVVTDNVTYSNAIDIATPAANQQATMMFRSAASAKWQLGKGTDDGFFLNYATTGRTDFQISTAGSIGLALGSGKVGVGTASPAEKLDVAGTIRQSNCTAAGPLAADASGNIICSTSDARLKDLLGAYVTSLDALMQLRPQRFRYKAAAGNARDTKIHAGFVAQDVQSAIPEAVTKQANGYYAFDPTSVLAVAVNAIQALKVSNDQQAREIQALRAQVRELRSAGPYAASWKHEVSGPSKVEYRRADP